MITIRRSRREGKTNKNTNNNTTSHITIVIVLLLLYYYYYITVSSSIYLLFFITIIIIYCIISSRRMKVTSGLVRSQHYEYNQKMTHLSMPTPLPSSIDPPCISFEASNTYHSVSVSIMIRLIFTLPVGPSFPIILDDFASFLCSFSQGFFI